MTPKRSNLAQSRIDYIVYGNPKQVSKLVYDYGFTPPKSLNGLSDAVHELIAKQGKKVIVDLIRLHPDKGAILSVFNEREAQPANEAVPQEPPTKTEQAPAQQPVQADQKNEPKKCSNCGAAESAYDCFCGCSHSYDSMNESLADLSTSELRKKFVKLSEQSEADPQNKLISDEATRVWNEIRVRNQSASQPDSSLSSSFSISAKDGLIVLLLTVIAGILIGYSSVKAKQYASA